MSNYDENELEKNKIRETENQKIAVNVINDVTMVLSFDTLDDDGNVRHKQQKPQD